VKPLASQGIHILVVGRKKVKRAIVMLAIMSLPDPETALKLWAAGFGVVTAACVAGYQVFDHRQRVERKRRRKALGQNVQSKGAESVIEKTFPRATL